MSFLQQFIHSDLTVAVEADKHDLWGMAKSKGKSMLLSAATHILVEAIHFGSKLYVVTMAVVS